MKDFGRARAVMREFWDLCVDGGRYAWEIGFMRDSADLCVIAGVYACLLAFMRFSEGFMGVNWGRGVSSIR